MKSLKCGWGGDTRIAGLLGIDSGTVARGRRQLLAQDVERQRRAPPRWRAASAEKKTPHVIAAIEAQLKYDVAGDPITGIRWTHRTTEKIAELHSLSIPGLSGPYPQGPPLSAARQPQARLGRLRPGPRPAVHLHRLTARQVRRARPAIVSIDAKKRELVGNFKNPGSGWAKTPQAVNDHDFRSQAIGIAIPYGIYDVTANRGFVVVGTSHDTPDFAADNLVRWWQREGCQRYPQCP